AGLHTEGVDAVVAPVPPAGELRHRHELDGVDAHVDEPVQLSNDGVERPYRREGADVQLVQDEVGEVNPPPVLVVPVASRVDYLRWPVYAVRLAARGGVGPVAPTRHPVQIPPPGLHLVDNHFVPSMTDGLHRDQAIRAKQVQHHLATARRPDVETAA